LEGSVRASKSTFFAALGIACVLLEITKKNKASIGSVEMSANS
jgi:hypothetical protein